MAILGVFFTKTLPLDRLADSINISPNGPSKAEASRSKTTKIVMSRHVFSRKSPASSSEAKLNGPNLFVETFGDIEFAFTILPRIGNRLSH